MCEAISHGSLPVAHVHAPAAALRKHCMLRLQLNAAPVDDEHDALPRRLVVALPVSVAQLLRHESAPLILPRNKRIHNTHIHIYMQRRVSTCQR
jgi:hypothetical protein